LRRGMAAHRTEIDYLRAAVLGDRVLVGTWIAGTDSKLRVQRRFQVRRAADGETLVQARTDYVCINLDSGRAARMPDVFQRAYIVTQPVPAGDPLASRSVGGTDGPAHPAKTPK